MSGPVTTGNLLSRTFSLFGAGLLPFLAITALFHLPLLAFQTLAIFSESPMAPVAGSFARLFLFLVLGILFTTVGQAALVYGVFNALRGESVTVGECLRIGLSRWLPVVLLSILFSISLMIGFMLCILPGFVVYCGLFVAVPALMAERLSTIDAFHRSWDLTEGYKLSIFGAVLVLAVIEWAAGAVVQQVGGLGVERAIVITILSLLIQVILATLKGVAAGVAYYDIRVFREGLDEDELAAVFD